MRVSPSTLGIRIHSIEIAGLVLTETRHEPRMALPEHSHETPGVTLVLDGDLIETYAESAISADPWSMIVRPAHREHSNTVGSVGCHALVIEVLAERLERLSPLTPLFRDPCRIGGAGVAGTAKRLYAEFKSGDVYSDLALEGLVLELFAQASRQEKGCLTRSSEPHWLVRARGIMRDRFAQNIGLSEVASCVGVHPVHLARTFREHYGQTVGEHIRKLRIDYAADRLSESPMPLAEIAERAGFSDQSHFCRLFRRHTGMTPSQFRKASRAG